MVSDYDLQPVQKDHNGNKRKHFLLFAFSLVLVSKPLNVAFCVFQMYILCVYLVDTLLMIGKIIKPCMANYSLRCFVSRCRRSRLNCDKIYIDNKFNIYQPCHIFYLARFCHATTVLELTVSVGKLFHTVGYFSKQMNLFD